jgi:Ca2+-transporting ATPase
MVAVIALARGMGWVEVLLTSVSLAVAALPEGLPAVVTIALAVGVRRMSRRDVLVRRLAAVETLGSATVICTDKTGTLTTGVMEVREVWGERAAVLRAAASASSAVLDHTGGGTGDPTELALLRAAREAGIESSALEADNPTVDVEPFDVTTRMMTVRRRDGTVDRKGAFEAVLPSCGPCPDGAHEAHDAHDAHDTMTARGLRVLAVASGRDDGLTLLGLVGFADPPRPEALAAIAQAKRAGIRVVMITGDHPRTANAIAEEMGVGEVFARKTATDKLAIVQQLRARGEVVAMTGDGVNDAPSIKEADIGVAMGKSATEATRQAADMILTEDNLSGIVHAIREGRVIFGNLRKTVVYLLGGNAAELMFVTLATAMGLPMPLLPLQLLWINLLSEPLPGIALAIDRPETDVLDHPPRPRTEPLLGRRQWIEIAVVAALQAALVLAAYAWALQRHDVPTARTFAFSVLVFGVVVRALAGRSATRIYWEAPLGNPRLIAVVAIAVALQIGVVYLGPAQRLFGTTALTYADMGLAFGLGLVPVTLVELSKLARRWRAHAHRP